jgi:WXG100 family type VII secretion target
MTRLRGGQTGEMRSLAGKFRRDADTLNGVISSLNAETSSSEAIWKGPAADRFRGDWQQFKPTLDKLVAALNEAARSIDTNAQNIDNATA